MQIRSTIAVLPVCLRLALHRALQGGSSFLFISLIKLRSPFCQLSGNPKEHFLNMTAQFGRSLKVKQIFISDKLRNFLRSHLPFRHVSLVPHKHKKSIRVRVALYFIDPIILDVLE